MASGVRGRGRDDGVTGSIVSHGPASLSSDRLTTWCGGTTTLAESKSARRTFRSVCGTYSDGLGRRLVAVPLAVVGRRAGLLLRAGFTAGHGDTSTVGPRPITARRALSNVVVCTILVPAVTIVTVLAPTTGGGAITIISACFTPHNFMLTIVVVPPAPAVEMITGAAHISVLFWAPPFPVRICYITLLAFVPTAIPGA